MRDVILCVRDCRACLTSFFALSGASFFVCLRDKIFGHTWLTSLTKMTSLFEIDFYLL